MIAVNESSTIKIFFFRTLDAGPWRDESSGLSPSLTGARRVDSGARAGRAEDGGAVTTSTGRLVDGEDALGGTGVPLEGLRSAGSFGLEVGLPLPGGLVS